MTILTYVAVPGSGVKHGSGGLDGRPLLQWLDMADWRQIQARIRKAKNSPDAVSKLSDLFKRTRDGMVAWELGTIEEKAEHKEEAGNWYVIAAQRFRRADWKKKAEEALTRLGIEIPAAAVESFEPKHSEPSEPPQPKDMSKASETQDGSGDAAEGNGEEVTTENSEMRPVAAATGVPGQSRKRRRGRRGGRGRKRKGTGSPTGLPSQAFAQPVSPAAAPVERTTAPIVERRAMDRMDSEPAAASQLHLVSEQPPQLPSERATHGRTEPGVSSRMARLESMLRRLLSSPLRKLDEADDAPAGPGVFLLSDADQTSSYYIESCQTLRVGISNLVKGGRGGKGGRGANWSASDESLKAKLADHLEINEAKVSQYMKDHCVVRWIQLDEDAPLLAHFAIAVLRTPLNLQ